MSVVSFDPVLLQLIRDNLIHDLDLTGRGIGPENAKTLALALYKNSCLCTLNLGMNELSDSGCQQIASILHPPHFSLSELSLWGNGIGEIGAQCLARALRENLCLKMLTLEQNHLGEKGSRHLAQALLKNSTLHSLSLFSNDIGDKGVEHLSLALCSNSSLFCLNLGLNGIRKRGAYHLTRALHSNFTLHTLNLGANQIPFPRHLYVLQHDTRETLRRNLFQFFYLLNENPFS